MLDQLVNSVRLEALWRISRTGLIQLQLRSVPRVCAYMRGSWHLIDRRYWRKYLLDSHYERVGETIGVTHSSGISPELCFSPPDECLPSV